MSKLVSRNCVSGYIGSEYYLTRVSTLVFTLVEGLKGDFKYEESTSI